MCGRYTITIDKSTIEHRFGGRFYVAQPDYAPTYNAAPSQLLPIMRTYHPDRIELARWRFVPEDWNQNARVRPQNNARLETAAEKPMFASSFSARHCIVLADGFYEWKTKGPGARHMGPFSCLRSNYAGSRKDTLSFSEFRLALGLGLIAR
jgi:putative SOS response-associated peptidase YedK